ncbi:MAG: MEDS domain-containing protein [Candidatus Omnitrophica bacterium]|nr:MEDS domain-containing protein [Candidatus Omnitrophota bacterium]
MKAKQSRKTDIPWIETLPWGTHFCHLHREQSELHDAVVPFLRAGLESNEACLWVGSGGSAPKAREALREGIPDFEEFLATGALVMISAARWVTSGGNFDTQQAVEDWRVRLTRALAEGHEGLRVALDASTLRGCHGKAFPEFEAAIDRVVAGQPILVLCAYRLGRVNAPTLLDILRDHPLASLRRNGEWDCLETRATARGEWEYRGHLRFFESLDRVNRAIQGTNDLEEMMSEVLGEMLGIFECDRAWLVYPCDPETKSWRVPMERTRPEYPGALVLGIEVPVDSEAVRVFRIANSTDGPVRFGPGSEHPLPGGETEQFGLRSQIVMALHPKGDRPWLFGLHQCSHPRVWTSEEARLFEEIGRRMTDALTSLLTYRDLRESEAKYRRIVDTAVEGILVLGADTRITFVNARMAEMVGVKVEEMVGQPLTSFLFEEELSDHHEKMAERRRGLSSNYERRLRRKDGSEVWTLASAVPILDSSGDFRGSFAMFTDITDRKRAEHRLQEHLNELQRWHDLTLNREERVQELKAEVNLLLEQLGEPHRYGSQRQ